MNRTARMEMGKQTVEIVERGACTSPAEGFDTEIEVVNETTLSVSPGCPILRDDDGTLLEEPRGRCAGRIVPGRNQILRSRPGYPARSALREGAPLGMTARVRNDCGPSRKR